MIEKGMEMSEKLVNAEKSIRIGTPLLYKRMIETFEKYHIHPYDVQGAVIEEETGFEVILKFANTFNQPETVHFSFEQAKHPDSEVTQFFEEAAEKCKSQLISDYYKMIKP